MKAFVIKNKEGKYLSFSPIDFNKDIRDAAIFKNTDLLQYCNDTSVILKETKVVPITISEGDLEKALELACQKINEMQSNKPAFICGDYFIDKYNIEGRMKTYDANYFIQQAMEIEKDER